MEKITAILRQRGADYHISVVNQPAIWDCGKTLKKAIDNFKKTAESHDLEMQVLKIDVNTITETT